MELDLREWFGKRTFHYSQFEPITALRDAKERLGTSISVCIPARNEEATIGRVVRVLRRDTHGDRCPQSLLGIAERGDGLELAVVEGSLPEPFAKVEFHSVRNPVSLPVPAGVPVRSRPSR